MHDPAQYLVKLGKQHNLELKLMIAKWHHLHHLEAASIIWKRWVEVRSTYFKKVTARRLELCERFCGWKMCDMCGDVRPSKKCSGCVRPASKVLWYPMPGRSMEWGKLSLA